MERQTDKRQTAKQPIKQTDGQTNSQSDRQTDSHIDGQPAKQMERQTDKQTDSQAANETDRWTDKQPLRGEVSRASAASKCRAEVTWPGGSRDLTWDKTERPHSLPARPLINIPVLLVSSSRHYSATAASPPVPPLLHLDQPSLPPPVDRGSFSEPSGVFFFNAS